MIGRIATSALIAAVSFVFCIGCERGNSKSPAASIDIHEAARNGDVAAVQRALDAGISTETLDRFGRTPLCPAAARGHVGVVELLIARGADLNVVSDGRMTALCEAVCCKGDASRINDCLEVVNILLDAGAMLEIDEPFAAIDAVQFAASTRNVEMLELLLEHGARATNREGWTLLHSLCDPLGGDESDLPDVVALILKRTTLDIDTRSYQGITPLFLAVDDQEVALVRELLAQGADPDVAAPNGDTALIRAAEQGDLAVVRLLLEFGADTEIRGNRGKTAAERAADLWHEEIVEVLAGAKE